MVCDKCEKKLQKGTNPDHWKQGSRNAAGTGRTTGGDSRFVKRTGPLQSRCIVCKAILPNEGKYCLKCAHSRGVCMMCGEKLEDRSLKGQRYKQ
ncbi:putative cysteine-rich PDZ-binding protein [Blattamonas nauphoetae]|uniref:Cysteine-rich PDZ-binding protein n=1 Tax=Blattamonas nauphoetae TaxID=2049346 RepID=A0ABQ9YH92_9EUKA|nr:putative cysteine-rich PDZ-binding protein [Blattamonas nauphoetae]